MRLFFHRDFEIRVEPIESVEAFVETFENLILCNDQIFDVVVIGDVVGNVDQGETDLANLGELFVNLLLGINHRRAPKPAARASQLRAPHQNRRT